MFDFLKESGKEFSEFLLLLILKRIIFDKLFQNVIINKIIIAIASNKKRKEEENVKLGH